VIVPAAELPAGPGELALLTSSVQSAEDLHRVDVHGLAFDVAVDHPGRLATDELLDKLRARASRTIVDDSTKELIDVGFVEVVP
jgi:hypothetical protein